MQFGGCSIVYWYFFSQNNWHDGGNSTEQYARTMSKNPCVYIHGGKSKKFLVYYQMQIMPQIEENIRIELERRDVKIAMFARPTEAQFRYLNLAKQYGAKIIYRAVDDWALWEDNQWYDRNIELKMIEAADLAVASSLKLAKEFQIKYLPNACQYIQKDVKRFNSEPVVGFLGDLDNQISSAKVDVDLIFYLARRFSNVKFILIGSKKSWDFPSNVTVLNYMKWEEANEILNNIDIGLIPYCGRDITGVQPTKSWEYMGYGIPQVARRYLSLPEHSSVRLYESYEECGQVLEKLINSLNVVDRQEIINFASQNTWAKRIEKLIEWLE